MNKHLIENYDEYRESENIWYKKIPKHWKIIPLKNLSSSTPYSFIDGPFGSNLKSEEYTETGIPLIQLNNIEVGFHSTSNLKFISDEKALTLSRHKIYPGDIAIAKMAEPVARACVVSNDFPVYIIVADCMKFKPNTSKVNNQFISYALNSNPVKNQAEFLSSGTTRIRINLGTTKFLKLLIPPLEEQQSIANYLDSKTAHIDRQIELLTQKAAKYSELKQSLINKTVTRGLDKSVPMKDSGVEWIGEVPEHWEVKRLKDVIDRIESGSREKGGASNKGVISISAEHINWHGQFDFTNAKYISKGYYDKMTRGKLRIGDTLLTKDGATIGKCAYLDKLYYNKMAINEHMFLIRSCLDTDSKYLYYLITSSLGYIQIRNMMNTTAIPGINANFIMHVLFPSPRKVEQQSIANYLDSKTAHINSIIETINTKIDKLKELRKTLINDVVTGKIKVV